MPERVVAEVKTVLLFSFDNLRARELADFVPAAPDHFGVALQVFIGEPGSDLTDSFDFVVCSPTWFVERAASGKGWSLLVDQQHESNSETVLVGTGFLFMRSWDSAELVSVLTDLCDAASGGPDWGTVASRIGRALPWEYDYQYDEHVDANYGVLFPTPR